MRLVRQVHLYFGVLIAPTILFFAITGALQLFGLHEADRDTGYKPPLVIEKLSEVHIHQRFAEKPKRKAPPKAKAPDPVAEAARPAPAGPKPPEAKRGVLVKWVFLAAALGLVLSTILGLWMGLTQSRNRRLAFALLALGAILPVLLLAL